MKAQDKSSLRQHLTHENLAGENNPLTIAENEMLRDALGNDYMCGSIADPHGPRIGEFPYHPNNWANIADQYLLSPIYGGMGRVLIKQDEFKSRFDCTNCGGKGHTDEVCPTCNGTKKIEKEINKVYKNDEWTSDKITVECEDCRPSDSNAINKPYGYKLCPKCDGKQGTIIIPDDAKSDTTMGIIIAISDTEIKCVKPGDKVMYSSYYGTKFEFVGNLLRIGTEKDLFCLVKQLKQNVDSVKEQGFADLENTGVPHE